MGGLRGWREGLVGIGLVAEDLFASALGDEVGLAGECGDVFGLGPEEDALRPGPLEADGGGVFEDAWGVGEEAGLRERGAAAGQDMDVVAVEIKAESAG